MDCLFSTAIGLKFFMVKTSSKQCTRTRLINEKFILFSLLLTIGYCFTTTSISWDGCKYISDFDDIKFKITVVDEYKNERSKVENIKLTVPKLQLNLMVNCTGNDVTANWELTSYPYNIDEYCLKYCCGEVNKEMVGYRFGVRGGGRLGDSHQIKYINA